MPSTAISDRAHLLDDTTPQSYRLSFGQRETVLLALGLELFQSHANTGVNTMATAGDVLLTTTQSLEHQVTRCPELAPSLSAIRHAGHLEILRKVAASQLRTDADRSRYAELVGRRIGKILEMLGPERLLCAMVDDEAPAGLAGIVRPNGELRLLINTPEDVQLWSVAELGSRNDALRAWLTRWHETPACPEPPPGSRALACDLPPPRSPSELVALWLDQAAPESLAPAIGASSVGL